MDYHLRHMRIRDVEMVKKIDHEAFPTTWPRPQFKRELSGKNSRYLVVCSGKNTTFSSDCWPPGPVSPERLVGFTARALRFMSSLRNSHKAVPLSGEKILGFVGILLIDDKAHITAIATETQSRRNGIGELLLIGGVELGWSENVRLVTLEVRVSNNVAQSLYKKYGFIEQGIRKRYYLDNHEDALIMSTPEINSSEYREKFECLVRAYEKRWENSGKIMGHL